MVPTDNFEQYVRDIETNESKHPKNNIRFRSKFSGEKFEVIRKTVGHWVLALNRL